MNKYCTNCGNPLPADATACPVCGQPVAPVSSIPDVKATAPTVPAEPETPSIQEPVVPVQPQPEIPVPEPEPIVEPKSGSKTGVIALVLGLLVVIGVGGYYGWNMYSERQLWDEVSQSTEPTDYERYLDRFPNGAHHAMAMARYKDLKSTLDEWMVLESEADYDLYRNFVRSHPESAYREVALQRMDSIAWAEALRADSPAGYRKYLDRMPKGVHAEEATAKAENMEMHELTPMEEDRVTDVINSFFSAAEYNNVDDAITHFPAEFSFMGRAANKVHVINYVRSLHGEGVYRTSVTPSNFVVKKDVDEKRDAIYTMTFNLDVRTIYDGDNPDVFTSYTGAAIVDSNDMITSLALRRVASM